MAVCLPFFRPAGQNACKIVHHENRFTAIPSILRRQLGPLLSPRIVLLTGARQTGKTTLARKVYPDLAYFNLDAPEQREAIRAVRADAWAATIGPAILDEAQKEPSLFDKVKFAFDAGQIERSVLLGSSQILMLQRVRETLAGRAFVYELWPLMASEIVHAAGEEPPAPLLDRLLREPGSADELLGALPSVRFGEPAAAAAAAIDHLQTWGGMPGLLPLPDAERFKWLQSYDATYLERDLGDLARLDDLLPFHRFQRLCALRSAQLLSYSELARDGGLAVNTSRRYIEYLRDPLSGVPDAALCHEPDERGREEPQGVLDRPRDSGGSSLSGTRSP